MYDRLVNELNGEKTLSVKTLPGRDKELPFSNRNNDTFLPRVRI